MILMLLLKVRGGIYDIDESIKLLWLPHSGLVSKITKPGLIDAFNSKAGDMYNCSCLTYLL